MSWKTRAGGFFRWWVHELSSLLPPSLVQSLQRRVDVLEFELADGHIVVSRRKNGTPQPLGQIRRAAAAPSGASQTSGVDPATRATISSGLDELDPHNTRVMVRLPAELALTKDIELPLAAEENLYQVLQFEMPRLTPFVADEVYFSYRVIKRDPESRRITVRVWVAPRRVVDEALGLVSEWNLRPDTSGAASDSSAELPTLQFIPYAYRSNLATRLNLSLAVVNAVLLALVVSVPLIQQRAELRELDEQLTAARREAGDAADIQERVDRLEAELRALYERKDASPTAVELIDDLSAMLPDTTWVTRLQIRSGELRLQGMSEAASSLIQELEASGLFREVRFGSPVTQDVRSGRERFQLTAKILRPTAAPGLSESSRARHGSSGAANI